MQLGNRYSQHSFAQIPDVKMARSQFDRSHTVKDTFDFDYLTPCFVDEVLPGDTFNVTLATFARLSSYALKNPIMDNMEIDYHFFFVPNRLTWDNWERFNGAQTDPGDTTDYVIPQVEFGATSAAVGSIYDHMGLITLINNMEVNALPLRAYNLIYNEWFRDQNLQNSVTVPKDDGPDAPGDFVLLKSNKKHDYFTSMLKTPQKGPAVDIPLGTSAPVLGLGKVNVNMVSNNVAVYETATGATTFPKSTQIADATADYRWFGEQDPATGYPMIRADLSEASAATINQLRQAMSIQSLLELDNRGGTRYVEILAAHFNVTSPDFRLQRPEYLGGGKQTINSHPVAQTSPTSGSNALGQVAAFGTSANQGNNVGFTKSFVEHGYVIGLMRARADITYQQGINRLWLRQTRFDFFWPKLQEIGEQAVLLEELYFQGTSADKTVIGYQERYAEYRYKPSEIRGLFRSTDPLSLDSWHLAQEFGSAPGLNSTFIESSTPIERALAITTGPDLLIDMWFDYKCARPMVAYSVPSSFGRF